MIVEECINLIIKHTSTAYDKEKLLVLYEILILFIFDCITPRHLGNETLTQQTWTRHALISEVVGQVEKFYIYNKKKLTKEQKKTYVLITLNIIEWLAQNNKIKQELITIYSGDVVSWEKEGVVDVCADVITPHIDEKERKKFKTIYVYSALGDLKLNLNTNYWNVSIIPLKQYIHEDGAIYHQGVTFKSIQKVTLENKYSARHIILEDITILNKIKNMQVYINPNLYKLIKQKAHENTKIEAVDVIQAIKTDIYQMKIPVYTTTMKKESSYLGKERTKSRIDRFATQKKIKFLQKRVNKQLILLDFLMLGQFKNLFDRPLYFYFMFDFRGRLYYKSKISPQNTYLFRYIYDYGAYRQEYLDIDLALPIDYQSWYEVIKQSLGLQISLREVEKRILFWLVIEFAKLQKNLHTEAYNGVYSIENFIHLGLQIAYQGAFVTTDTEKSIQYNYIMYIWNELTTQQTLSRHYLIYKDATASAIQLLTVYLGPVSKEIAIYTNLDSYTHWYDTYHYIIRLFKETHVLQAESQSLFTRTNLKKTIMTYNYSATFYTCWQEFEDQLQQQFTNINQQQLQKIKQDFKMFYQYLDELFNKKNIFAHSLEGITKELLTSYEEKKQITIQSSDKAIIHLHYLRGVLRRWSLQNNNARKTIQMYELQNKLDVKKTRQAIKPNTTHALDAALIRETLVDLDKSIITIHDCYGIDIFNIDSTLYSLNKNINRINNGVEVVGTQQWFSIFIIL